MLKKSAFILIVIVAAIIMLTPIALTIMITAVNDNTAAQLEQELLAIPLPENSYYVESLSQAGKLWGNGNGMQYYAAMLISSELPLDELELYYLQYNCAVSIQRTTEINTDHGEFHFSPDIFPDRAYIVEKFGSGINDFFEQADLRGH